MTKSRETKKQLAELLSMSPSAAERKLRKAIIYELARQLGKNRCLHCNLEISDPDDFAVVHVDDWTDGPSFFDLGNVAFSHASCRAGRQDRRQGEREMQRVQITVEDSRGRPLRGCVHEGLLYVGGNKDQRYQVRVRNRTGKRLCVVVTVDGRNVNTGEVGAWDGSGFVLEAHQEWVFKGWRQSNEKVAAFRLGAKEDGYSSQMGTGGNTGVIGVAVFEEEAPPAPVITVKETKYVPMPYPVPSTPWPRYPYPYQPLWTNHTDNTGSGLIFDSGTRIGGMATTTTTASTAAVVRGGGEVNCMVGDGHTVAASSFEIKGSSTKKARSNRRKGRRRRGGSSAAPREHEQELGTEFGEALESEVKDTSFERSSEEPLELHLIRYDSVSALKKAGIMDGKPSQKKPQAFPDSPDTEHGFCQPPPRRKWV